MKTVRVACIQMISGADVSANLAMAERQIERAAQAGARLVVLPETFAVFGNRKALLACAENETGQQPPVRSFLSEQADTHGIVLVGGTVPVVAHNGRARAVIHVFDEQGGCLAEYDKIHLFDADIDDATRAYRESRDYLPGEHVEVVDTSVGRLGVACCYDIRFPEMFRVMQERGMDILAVAAAFTRPTGLAHWLPLLRARAIENQCIVLGANQGGIHSSKRQTSGGSVVIDAWGRVLAEAGFGEGCLVANVDLEEMRRIRQRMPVRSHRRIPVGGKR